MDQKEFDEILKKFLRGELSSEEEKIVEQWYSNIEDSAQPLGIFEKFRLRTEMQRALHAHKQGASRTARERKIYPYIRPSHSLRFKLSLAVAMFAGILVMSYVLLVIPSASGPGAALRNENFSGRIVENSGASPKVLALADGSRITLRAGSIIEIIESFNGTSREIFLRKGDAFFEVTRDETRPFFVYTDRVVTKVLGTSFRVDATRPDIVVAVKTGSVAVFPRSGPSDENLPKGNTEVVLAPNQQVIYDSNQGKMFRLLVNEPSVVLPPNEVREMQFESARVPVILDAMAKAYGVDIKFDGDLLSSCLLTTSIHEDEGMFKRLQVICEAIGATYQVEGITITVVSNGCPVTKELETK